MARKKDYEPAKHSSKRSFHMNFLHDQKIAWSAFEQHDVLFLLGPAGTGKTYLACAFALNEVISKKKKKIVITRPVVEAGECLGFLPGTLEEKVYPYMLPIYDCIGRLVGYEGPQRESVNSCMEIAPLAYLRGRTFSDSVIILDEAQNASDMQLKMFLTRFADNTKVIVTGDPDQSDVRWPGNLPLTNVVTRLETLDGIGIVKFAPSGIVRHPLVGKILDRLT
jgi:phosphate starvation-inducible PhoH-like protein